MASSEPLPETQVETVPAMIFKVANSVLSNGGGSMFSNNIINMPEPPKPIDPSKAKRCPSPSPRFTGRDDALKKIKDCFFADDGQQHIFVLHGLGGAGKTQIAYKFISEYCYETDGNSRRIPLACHLDASSSETLEASFNQIAKSAGLGTTKDDVIIWLSSRTGSEKNWVLLFDNADDIELDLRLYFPSGCHGNILITSRNADAPGEYASSGDGSSYEVGDLKPDEARILLRKVVSLSSIPDFDLDNLAKSLGYLALALAQAGSAIRNWKMPVSQYLEEFRKRHSEIFRDDGIRGQKLDSYSFTVYTTWVMSYKRLSTVAKEFLGICSFLHNRGILEEFFQRAAQEILRFSYPIALSDEEMAGLEGLRRFLGNFAPPQDGSWDTLCFQKMIVELKSYSLLQDDDGSYSIHVLVHQWARALVAEKKLVHSYALLLFALGERWTGVIYALKVVPHLQELTAGINVGSLPTYVAEAFGIAYLEAEWAKQADPLLQHAMEVKKRNIGQDHKLTLETMASLASANQLLGKLKEAEEMERKVLEQSKAILGETHPNTSTSMANLAVTLRHLGKLREAEEMERKVLEQRKAILGEIHPHTITSMGSFAATLYYLGKIEEAEGMLRKVLEQRKAILGETHPDTIRSMANLAATLQSLGKLEEAEEMERKVLEQSKAILGETHPHTITHMANLAVTLYSLGKLEEVEEMERKVLEQRKAILGETHPNTITCMANLAVTLHSLGKLEEAVDMERKVLEQSKAILGETHPDTIKSMGSFAATLYSLGKLEEAEEMQRKVLEQGKAILEDTHPNTIRRMGNLAVILCSLGKLEEAEEMQRNILEQSKAILGETHPDTVSAQAWYEAIKKHIREVKRTVPGDTVASFPEIGGHEVGQGEVDITEIHAGEQQPESGMQYPPTTSQSVGLDSKQDIDEAGCRCCIVM